MPNADDLGVEHLELELDDGGFVPVDGQLRTAADGVWALGDLCGDDMFTHTPRDDAEVAYRSVFKQQDRTITDRVVPHAVFVDPEVAAVGLTEDQARDVGRDVAVGIQQFTGVAKAKAIGETRGFIKFVADATTDRILGCHIVGPDAGNLVHEAVVAMVADAPYSDIGRAIHIHPGGGDELRRRWRTPPLHRLSSAGFPTAQRAVRPGDLGGPLGVFDGNPSQQLSPAPVDLRGPSRLPSQGRRRTTRHRGATTAACTVAALMTRLTAPRQHAPDGLS